MDHLQNIREILADHFAVDPSEIHPETRLTEDLLADSLDHVEILYAIEDRYNREIPDEIAETLLTVSQIITFLETE